MPKIDKNRRHNLKINIPPQNQEAERAVLGVIILENTAIHKVMGYLRPDTFFNPSNQTLWTAILELNRRGKAIDGITIMDYLIANDLTDASLNYEYVASLTNGIVSSYNLEAHARIVEEKAIARRIISISMEKVERLYRDDEDISELLGEMDMKEIGAKSSLTGNKNPTSRHIGQKLLDQITEAMARGNGIVGVPTGLIPLDNIISGLRKGRVYTFAARTRHGKSAVAAAFAYHSVKNGTPCVMFSMEMPDVELYARMVSMELRNMGENIPYTDIDSAQLTADQFEKVKAATEIVMGYPLIIDDTPALTSAMIRSLLIKYITEYKIESAYIDYVQLAKKVKEFGENKADSIEQLMAEFKTCAKALEIPVVVLSQVGRAAEENGRDGRPTLVMLKGSSGLEENSDVILLMWRPDVYDSDPIDENGSSLKGIMCIEIAKNKMGPTGIIKTPFDIPTNYFEELDFILPSFPGSETNVGRNVPSVPFIAPGDVNFNPDEEDFPPF